MNGIKLSDGSNMDKGEGRALKAHINDDSIVVMSANKGTGICIMDNNEYIKKMEGENLCHIK